MILDAGGGTVDITLHEITHSNELKEIYKANGGNWGGTMVDNAFEMFIIEIMGTDVFATFKEINVEEYLDLMRGFEVKKRETKPDKEVAIRIPVSLICVATEIRGESVQNLISESRHKKNVRLTGDKMKLHQDVVKGFFEESLKLITDHFAYLFQQPELSDLKTVLMVGGYSESLLLQQCIKDNFPSMKIVVPSDAGLAVLKGAVIYGHDPTVISQRICKYTYGNGAAHDFSEYCNHPPCRKSNENGIKRCNDIFCAHARAGDVIKLGKECQAQTFYPLEPLQQSITFQIYYTKERNPKLVTEPGCAKLGSVTIPMLNTTGGCSRSADLSFLFGGTEIEVKAKDDEDGSERKVQLSFMG